MENFRKKIKARILLLNLFNTILFILFVFGFLHVSSSNNKEINAFISGSNIGICIATEIFVLYHLAKYYKALKDEVAFKNLYIYENDERRIYIKTQIGGLGLNIVIFTGILATMIFGYFNQVVYFTLLSTLFFIALVKGILKFYYRKKL